MHQHIDLFNLGDIQSLVGKIVANVTTLIRTFKNPKNIVVSLLYTNSQGMVKVENSSKYVGSMIQYSENDIKILKNVETSYSIQLSVVSALEYLGYKVVKFDVNEYLDISFEIE